VRYRSVAVAIAIFLGATIGDARDTLKGVPYDFGGQGRQAPPPFDVRFADVTKESGIDFKHESSPTPQKYLIETMGGGVAVLDFDNDGWLDVFFTNGAPLSAPMAADARPLKSDRFANRLYRNNHDGTFADVTRAARVDGVGTGGYGMGVAIGDYDNDGFDDVYVTAYDRNTLYRNDGHGHFADVTARAGVAAGGWSVSAAFFDYDNDGSLDLIVTRYVEWSFARDDYCGARRPGYREYCHRHHRWPHIANTTQVLTTRVWFLSGIWRNRGIWCWR